MGGHTNRGKAMKRYSIVLCLLSLSVGFLVGNLIGPFLGNLASFRPLGSVKCIENVCVGMTLEALADVIDLDKKIGGLSTMSCVDSKDTSRVAPQFNAIGGLLEKCESGRYFMYFTDSYYSNIIGVRDGELVSISTNPKRVVDL